MGKVKTGLASAKGPDNRNLVCKYAINVTTTGLFTAQLPEDIVDQLEALGVNLKSRQIRGAKPGYFENKDMATLERQIQDVITDAVSRELIEQKLMIEYAVQTVCSYVMDKESNLYATGSDAPNFNEDSFWYSGTNDNHLSDKPYSVKIFACPAIKRVYKYRSGLVKTEVERYSGPFRKVEDVVGVMVGPMLKMLNNFTNMQRGGMASQLIEYNEQRAEFFVRFIKMICEFNHKIKDLLTPEGIAMLAEAGLPPLLGSGDK